VFPFFSFRVSLRALQRKQCLASMLLVVCCRVGPVMRTVPWTRLEREGKKIGLARFPQSAKWAGPGWRGCWPRCCRATVVAESAQLRCQLPFAAFKQRWLFGGRPAQAGIQVSVGKNLGEGGVSVGRRDTACWARGGRVRRSSVFSLPLVRACIRSRAASRRARYPLLALAAQSLFTGRRDKVLADSRVASSFPGL